MGRKLLLLFIPLILNSCISLSTINIQILEPAPVPLTPHLGSAILLNRLIIEELENSEKIDSISPDTWLMESYNKATTEVLFSLADILDESPGFHYPDNRNLIEMPSGVQGVLPEPLDPGFVLYLCDSLGSDGIISLEGYHVEYNDSIISKPGETQTNWQNYYQMEVTLHITVLWRTYTNSGGGIIDEYLMEDTLQWVNAAYTVEELLDNKPSPDESIMEASYFSALTFARRVSPFWLEEERYIFSKGNYKLRVAAHYVQDNQLEKAEHLYEEMLGSGNSRVISAIAFNLALVNELRGDFRQALIWARRSYQIKRHPVTYEYIEILENRAEKTPDVDLQLGIRN